MCENVSASCFDCLRRRDEKKLPLDWKRAGQNPDPNPARNPAPPGLPTPYVALRFW